MARYIEQGKSIFIPFHKGVSITDSQLHLRMYKTEEMFKRHFPPNTEYEVLCEYAPVVRCENCFASGCCTVQEALNMGNQGYCAKGRREGE